MSHSGQPLSRSTTDPALGPTLHAPPTGPRRTTTDHPLTGQSSRSLDHLMSMNPPGTPQASKKRGAAKSKQSAAAATAEIGELKTYISTVIAGAFSPLNGNLAATATASATLADAATSLATLQAAATSDTTTDVVKEFLQEAQKTTDDLRSLIGLVNRSVGEARTVLAELKDEAASFMALLVDARAQAAGTSYGPAPADTSMGDAVATPAMPTTTSTSMFNHPPTFNSGPAFIGPQGFGAGILGAGPAFGPAFSATPIFVTPQMAPTQPLQFGTTPAFAVSTTPATHSTHVSAPHGPLSSPHLAGINAAGQSVYFSESPSPPTGPRALRASNTPERRQPLPRATPHFRGAMHGRGSFMPRGRGQLAGGQLKRTYHPYQRPDESNGAGSSSEGSTLLERMHVTLEERMGQGKKRKGDGKGKERE